MSVLDRKMPFALRKGSGFWSRELLVDKRILYPRHCEWRIAFKRLSFEGTCFVWVEPVLFCPVYIRNIKNIRPSIELLWVALNRIKAVLYWLMMLLLCLRYVRGWLQSRSGQGQFLSSIRLMLSVLLRAQSLLGSFNGQISKRRDCVPSWGMTKSWWVSAKYTMVLTFRTLKHLHVYVHWLLGSSISGFTFARSRDRLHGFFQPAYRNLSQTQLCLIKTRKDHEGILRHLAKWSSVRDWSMMIVLHFPDGDNMKFVTALLLFLVLSRGGYHCASSTK